MTNLPFYIAFAIIFGYGIIEVMIYTKTNIFKLIYPYLKTWISKVIYLFGYKRRERQMIKELSQLAIKNVKLELQYTKLVTLVKMFTDKDFNVLFYPQSRKYIKRTLKKMRKVIS